MMVYNKQRVSIYDYVYGDPASCPECGGELVAKRGDFISWHYAHKAQGGGCSHGESAWHLACKTALLKSPYWDVEVPIVCEWDGEERASFRLDAFCKDRLVAVEFINSLSVDYFWKAKCLMENHIWSRAEKDLFGSTWGSKLCGNGELQVIWIFNGPQFASARSWYNEKRGAFHRYFKPSAHDSALKLWNLGRMYNTRNLPPVLSLDKPSRADAGLFEILPRYPNYWIKTRRPLSIEQPLLEAV